MPGADLHQRADQSAHHPPQEVRGDDAHEDQRAVLDHLDASRPRRACSPCAPGSTSAKLRKSWRPTQEGGRGAQSIDVQRVAHPPHPRLRQRGAAPRDLVEVAARDGVVAGVERGLGGRGAEHVNVARQALVEGAAEVGGVEALLEAQMRALLQRVHAGVGASRSAELDHREAGFADRAQQRPHHRRRVLLLLPAAVARALVLDQQAVGGDLRRGGAARGGRRRRLSSHTSSPTSRISASALLLRTTPGRSR